MRALRKQQIWDVKNYRPRLENFYFKISEKKNEAIDKI